MYFIDKIKKGRNCKEIRLRHIASRRKTGKPRPAERSRLTEEPEIIRKNRHWRGQGSLV